VSPFADPDEAAAVQTYLNTDQYNLGYELKSSTYEASYKNVWKLVAWIATIILIAVGLSKYITKTFNLSGLLKSLAYVLFGLAFMKLMGIAVTTGFVVFALAVILLMLFKARNTYFIGLSGLLLLTLLVCYFNFIIHKRIDLEHKQ
jgi:uncharacterized membrane protein